MFQTIWALFSKCPRLLVISIVGVKVNSKSKKGYVWKVIQKSKWYGFHNLSTERQWTDNKDGLIASDHYKKSENSLIKCFCESSFYIMLKSTLWILLFWPRTTEFCPCTVWSVPPDLCLSFRWIGGRSPWMRSKPGGARWQSASVPRRLWARWLPASNS